MADLVLVNGLLDCAECGEEHELRNILVDKTAHTMDYRCPTFGHRVLAGASDEIMRRIP